MGIYRGDRSERMPAGVINLVQGARDTGTALASRAGIDGIFFTGSVAAGKALSRRMSRIPQLLRRLAPRHQGLLQPRPLAMHPGDQESIQKWATKLMATIMKVCSTWPAS